MAENGRLQKMGAVVESFATIMAAERGEVACEVTTAKVGIMMLYSAVMVNNVL